MSVVMAETRKVLAARTWWIGLLVGIALAAITIVSLTQDHAEAITVGGSTAQAALDDATRYWMTIYLTTAAVAAWGISKEFQEHEIRRSVLLYRQDRVSLAVRKLLGFLPVAGVFAVVTALLATTVPRLLLPSLGVELGGARTDWSIVAGLVLIQFFAAAWGFAVGLLLRNTAAALGFLLLQTLILETYGAQAVPTVGRYAFTSLMGSLYQDPGELSIDPWAAAGFATLWVAAALGLGVLLLTRRDV